MNDETTDAELLKYLTESQGYPVPEEKYNVHLFLHRVATSEDTIKVANLNQEEVGIPTHSVRSLKGLALISDKIIKNKLYSDFFNAESEILTASSLSKEGFLVKQATTSTRNIADVSKAKKQNKGWFRRKEKPEEGESQ